MSDRTLTSGTDHLRAASEVALAVVTITAILGMHRLFDDGSYRGALVLQAILAHLVVTGLRRVGMRILPAALTAIVAAVLAIAWTRFPDTLAWGLPTADTFRAVGDDVTSAWRLFSDVKAPAPVENGFVVTTAAVVWVIAFLADWAAFRLSAAFEALLPATTLLMFAAALGGDTSPIGSAAVFAAAALAFLLLRRTAIQERTSRWAGGHRHHGRSSLVATGAGIAGLAVVAGAIVGPNLPGADAEAVVPLQGLSEDEPTRRVPSPIVSLQTRLVEQSQDQVFTVRSERSSNWRLTSLDLFDGEIWRSTYQTEDADGELPRAVDSAAPSETVEQVITINALSSVWLPAAHQPVALDPGPGEQVVYDERSSTLMVDRGVTTSDGYSYTVTSDLADWDGDELRGASTEVPDGLFERYTDLPRDFPEQATAEAQGITAGATTPYDKAIALQNYFRSGRFTYDKFVRPGHSDEALLTFLFDTRRGYCEQFASAFAAMARSIDLPARVAVGYTPGERLDPTLYIVRGINAHAWPEVYLGEYGWVPFEPTPGIGPPGAPNWLGIEEQQATSSGEPAPSDSQAPDPGSAGDGSVTASGDENRQAAGGLGASAIEGGTGAIDDEPSVIARTVENAAPTVGLSILAYLALVPTALLVQAAMRRRRARTSADRVRLRWHIATGEAAELGVRLPPWMTIAEKAGAMSQALPGHEDAFAELSRRMEEISYAEAEPPPEEVASIERDQAQLLAEMRRRLGWRRRVLRWFDARRLFAAKDRTRIGPSARPSATLAD